MNLKGEPMWLKVYGILVAILVSIFVDSLKLIVWAFLLHLLVRWGFIDLHWLRDYFQ